MSFLQFYKSHKSVPAHMLTSALLVAIHPICLSKTFQIGSIERAMVMVKENSASFQNKLKTGRKWLIIWKRFTFSLFLFFVFLHSILYFQLELEYRFIIICRDFKIDKCFYTGTAPEIFKGGAKIFCAAFGGVFWQILCYSLLLKNCNHTSARWGGGH